MDKSKLTPICFYMFHLYYYLELLMRPEMMAYKVGKEMIIYSFDTKSKYEQVGGEDSEHKSLDLEEIEALLVVTKSATKHLKKIEWAQDGSPPIRIH